MDLRDRNLSPENLKAIEQFIVERRLGYQPFIFADRLEVGEGLRFHDGEASSGHIYWPDAPTEIQNLLVDCPEHFRECNRNLRTIYEFLLDTLVQKFDSNISHLTFAEIGCNTGYFLHGLGVRGAKRCLGFDFTNNKKVFEWFNQVLGINSEFYFAEWDSLSHSLRYAEIPEVDVVLSIAVLCHVADPLQHLAYLCDRARKAVLVYTPVTQDNNLSIEFGHPAKYPKALKYPLNFDNDIRLSIPLLKLALEQSGFGELYPIPCPQNVSEKWKAWFACQQGYIALRTSESKTALSSDATSDRLRTIPGDAKLTLDKIRQLQEQIEGMESSKFWKLREAWFQVKKALGLPER